MNTRREHDPTFVRKVTIPDTGKEDGRPRRPASDPGGPTGRLATWLADTTLNDIPGPVRERAKYLLLDGIACALVGAQLPVSRKGVAGVTALDGTGGAGANRLG
jgi:hypothetical protein